MASPRNERWLAIETPDPDAPEQTGGDLKTERANLGSTLP